MFRAGHRDPNCCHIPAGVTSLRHEQPWNQRMECFSVTLVRQIFEQIFIGFSSTVWPFGMKPSSPQLRLPVIAYPSLVTEVRPSGLKFEKSSELYKSPMGGFLPAALSLECLTGRGQHAGSVDLKGLIMQRWGRGTF